MYYDSLRVRGLWSFGAEQRLVLNRGVTAIIGRNNQGKSNLLGAIGYVRARLNSEPKSGIVNQQVPESFWHAAQAPQENAELDLAIRLEPSEVPLLFPISGESQGDNAARQARLWCKNGLKLIVRPSPNSTGHATVGLLPSEMEGTLLSAYQARIRPQSPFRQGPQGSPDLDMWDRLAVSAWKHVQASTVFLGTGRIPSSNSSHGVPYTVLMHDLFAPKESVRAKREQFQSIESFFSQLVEDDSARIVASPADINIETGVKVKKTLPLSSYGNGICHLLMMAIEIATRANSVILVEEPETSLHPSLQRRFVEFIKSHGNNQYLLATHSSVFLNSKSVDSVVHVTLDDGNTTLSLPHSMADKYDALDRLGVHASDVLQTDFVIWVEGPSDAVFLETCIKLAGQLNKEWQGLTRGIHFDFAHYGGSNRAHLRVGSDGDAQLLDILRVCRKAAYVWDSDRDDESTPVNSTKSRIQQECEIMGVFSWETAGREIENYLSTDLLKRAYESPDMLPGMALKGEFGKHAHLGEFLVSNFGEQGRPNGWKVKYDEHKVDIMKEVMKHMTCADLDTLDLKDKSEELCRRIRQANPPSRPL